MEEGCSLLHAQKPTVCPHPDPDQSHSNPNRISSHNFQNIHLSNSRSSKKSRSLRLRNNDPAYTSPVQHTCHIPYLSPFPSFGKFSSILWPTEYKSPHNLTLTFGASCLPASWKYRHVLYHAHCTTSSTLPLAMPTQSGLRAADGTGISSFLIFVTCVWKLGLIAAMIWDWFKEGYVVQTVHTLQYKYILCVMYIPYIITFRTNWT